MYYYLYWSIIDDYYNLITIYQYLFIIYTIIYHNYVFFFFFGSSMWIGSSRVEDLVDLASEPQETGSRREAKSRTGA